MLDLLNSDDATIELLASSMTPVEFEDLVIEYLIKNSKSVYKQVASGSDLPSTNNLQGLVLVTKSNVKIYIRARTNKIVNILLYYDFYRISNSISIWKKDLNLYY